MAAKFFSLPLELRKKVYSHLTTIPEVELTDLYQTFDSHHVLLRNAPEMKMMRVCKQVRREFSEDAFKNSTLVHTSGYAYKEFEADENDWKRESEFDFRSKFYKYHYGVPIEQILQNVRKIEITLDLDDVFGEGGYFKDAWHNITQTFLPAMAAQYPPYGDQKKRRELHLRLEMSDCVPTYDDEGEFQDPNASFWRQVLLSQQDGPFELDLSITVWSALQVNVVDGRMAWMVRRRQRNDGTWYDALASAEMAEWRFRPAREGVREEELFEGWEVEFVGVVNEVGVLEE